MAGGIVGVLTNVDDNGNEQEMYPVTVMAAVYGLDDEFATVRKEASNEAESIRKELNSDIKEVNSDIKELQSKTDSVLSESKKYSKEYTDSKHSAFTATLTTNDWVGSEAPYTQTIGIQGILASDIPHIYPVYSDTLETAIEQKEAWMMVNRAKTAAGLITFYCFEDKPTTAVPIQIEVNR